MTSTQVRLIHKWGIVISFVSIMFAGIFSGCDKLEQTSKQDTVRNDPVWTQYISAHTVGTISRHDSIAIRFVNDIISTGMVGTDGLGGNRRTLLACFGPKF